MKDFISESVIYEKKVAKEFKQYVDLITEVYQSLENISWSNISNHEIGFSIIDKKNFSNIFLGIWFDCWDFFGIPLCITMKYKKSMPINKYDQILYLLRNENNLSLKKDYQEFTLILFEKEYFNSPNYQEKILNLISNLKVILEIQ